MSEDSSTKTAVGAAAVTPSDSTIVNCRALYIGVAGNVAVLPVRGTTAVTFVGVLAGSTLPVQCAKVMSTNTTATSIIALF